jgi:hypothetical protein
MACAVLARVRHRAAALVLGVLFVSGFAHGTERRCPADLSAGAPAERRNNIRAFQQALTSAAFYKELSHRGRPLSCEMGLDEGIIRLSYAFRGKASLEAQVNLGSESIEIRMQVQSIGVNRAMALLKKAEKDAFGQNGCGIAWDHPAEELPGEKAGSREVVYRGDACNCQARLVYAGKSVVALILRSAC